MGNSEGRCAIERPDFAERYVQADLGGAERVAAILTHSSRSHMGIRGHRLRARAVADLIELAT